MRHTDEHRRVVASVIGQSISDFGRRRRCGGSQIRGYTGCSFMTVNNYADFPCLRRRPPLRAHGQVQGHPDRGCVVVRRRRPVPVPDPAGRARRGARPSVPLHLRRPRPAGAVRRRHLGARPSAGKAGSDDLAHPASELGRPAHSCFVVEDATSGVRAAKAGEMAALGVARLHDQPLLQQAGADLLVTTLDEVAIDALERGCLERASMV